MHENEGVDVPMQIFHVTIEYGGESEGTTLIIALTKSTYIRKYRRTYLVGYTYSVCYFRIQLTKKQRNADGAGLWHRCSAFG